MVRRAQLYRKPGSPLISGYLTPKGIRWGWVFSVLLLVSAVLAGVWYVVYR